MIPSQSNRRTTGGGDPIRHGVGGGGSDPASAKMSTMITRSQAARRAAAEEASKPDCGGSDTTAMADSAAAMTVAAAPLHHQSASNGETMLRAFPAAAAASATADHAPAHAHAHAAAAPATVAATSTYAAATHYYRSSAHRHTHASHSHSHYSHSAPSSFCGSTTYGPSASDAASHSEVIRYELELNQRRQTYGPSHPCVAETLNALGLVHQHMRSDPESALRCHAEALRILRRAAAASAARGECCDDVERMEIDNGTAGNGTGRSIAAAAAATRSTDSLLSAASATSRHSSSSTSSDEQAAGGGCDDSSSELRLRFDVAVTLSDMGDAYWKIGCKSDASAAYGSALEAFADAGKGCNHPRVVSTRRRLRNLERGVQMPVGR